MILNLRFMAFSFAGLSRRAKLNPLFLVLQVEIFVRVSGLRFFGLLRVEIDARRAMLQRVISARFSECFIFDIGRNT
jgi:hypothetical protein